MNLSAERNSEQKGQAGDADEGVLELGAREKWSRDKELYYCDYLALLQYSR
jgi:hypothetical protein